MQYFIFFVLYWVGMSNEKPPADFLKTSHQRISEKKCFFFFKMTTQKYIYFNEFCWRQIPYLSGHRHKMLELFIMNGYANVNWIFHSHHFTSSNDASLLAWSKSLYTRTVFCHLFSLFIINNRKKWKKPQ